MRHEAQNYYMLTVSTDEKVFFSIILTATFWHDPFTNASRTSPNAPLNIKWHKRTSQTAIKYQELK
jgi:hypothetical protein